MPDVIWTEVLSTNIAELCEKEDFNYQWLINTYDLTQTCEEVLVIARHREMIENGGYELLPQRNYLRIPRYIYMIPENQAFLNKLEAWRD